MASDPVHQAAGLTIGELLRARVRLHPDRIAVCDGDCQFRFAEFNARVNRLAAVLRGLGIGRGDRVAILSENRAEYLELIFAAGKLGVIVCALNWRLADPELAYCVTLTSPKVTFVSPNFAAAGGRLSAILAATIMLGDEYEQRLAREADAEPEIVAEPEDGHIILYTSGTTGNPKGALI
ncbi:MAG TPA: AMP-binding protein, partial [Rhodopila sp.]